MVDLAKLKEPFAPADVSWRIGQAGKNQRGFWAKVLAYVDNRAIMDRLDEVVGPDNWWNEYRAGPGGGVICGITINFGDRQVTKWDGAENTDIESVKGGLSDSMKRAAVQWGIGRYLYSLGEAWANINEGGAHYSQIKVDGKSEGFKWDHPQLPSWALPNGNGEPPAATVKKLEEQTGGKVKPAAKVLDEPALPEPEGKPLSPNQKRVQELTGYITAAKDGGELDAIAETCKRAYQAKEITKSNLEYLGSVSRQKRQSLAAMQEQNDFFDKSLNKELQQAG